MLDEYLNLYEQQANAIPDWRKINKNKLCNLYIENEHNVKLREAYFSAIIARYWPAMTKLYQRCSFGISIEDCYQWLVDGVLYALEHRSWLDENSPLYKDPNGPDKVINRCLKSKRLTHYQLLNKDKRVANLNTISIDASEDDLGDYAQDSLGLTSDTDGSPLETALDKMVKDCLDSHNYFTAILLDLIIYSDILEESGETNPDLLTLISKRKLHYILINEADKWVKDFCFRHPFAEELRTDIIRFVKDLSPSRIDLLLSRSLSSLRTAKMRKLLYR